MSESCCNTGLFEMRHSLAHVFAYALRRLYPETQLSIGPAIDSGFYYDFQVIRNGEPLQLKDEDIPTIEAEMKKIIDENDEITRREMSHEEALKFFAHEPFKLVILKELIPNEKIVSLYKMGDFEDLCEGPHVDRTKQISKYFKLESFSGSYLRGDSKREMLQRVHAIAFGSKKELDDYILMREEAKKRDHRTLNHMLDVYTFAPETVGPGLPLWTEYGTVIKNELDYYTREKERQYGLLRVSTPHIAKEALYKMSGHLPYYAESMYQPFDLDGEKMYLKSMNCPHHHHIYMRKGRSYRELPLRIAENAMVYRYEASGGLSGLMRVRGFQQNDMHLYVREDQAVEEFVALLELHKDYYRQFGIKDEDFSLELSLPDYTNKAKFAEDVPEWTKTAHYIREAIKQSGIPFTEVEGEAAFYGPKADFQIKSAIGVSYTISTTQLDWLAAKRFGLSYKGTDGEDHPTYVIHSAPLGSFERFIGFLIEHFAGNFPLWLAPTQVLIAPISEKVMVYADEVYGALHRVPVDNATAGIRVELDASDERLQKKIREATMRKIPYVVVVGEKEAASRSVSVRVRGEEKSTTVPLAVFIEKLTQSIQNRDLELMLFS